MLRDHVSLDYVPQVSVAGSSHKHTLLITSEQEFRRRCRRNLLEPSKRVAVTFCNSSKGTRPMLSQGEPTDAVSASGGIPAITSLPRPCRTAASFSMLMASPKAAVTAVVSDTSPGVTPQGEEHKHSHCVAPSRSILIAISRG